MNADENSIPARGLRKGNRDFAERRDTLVKAAGLAAAAGAFVALVLSVVLVGSFTVGHCTFVFAIVTGITAALLPSWLRRK